MVFELEVQKFLRSGNGLSDLIEQYAIEVRPCAELGVVVLNYNQILSPMNEQICQECRGLILEYNSWNMVSRSFFKFFNHDQELASPIDWTTARCQEKRDGSLINAYFYKDKWRIATKGSALASGCVGNHAMTFRDLVELTISDMGYKSFDHFTSYLCPGFFYSFELTSPENQVIIPYKNRRLTYLAAWKSFSPYNEVDKNIAVYKPYPFCIEEYPLQTYEEILETVKTLGQFNEGYVVVDAKKSRIKIKSPIYIACDRVMCRLATPRRKIELLISGTYDDVRGVLPDYVTDELDMINLKLQSYIKEILQAYSETKDIIEQKDFAIQINKLPFKAILFSLRKGQLIDDIIKNYNAEILAKMIGLE